MAEPSATVVFGRLLFKVPDFCSPDLANQWSLLKGRDFRDHQALLGIGDYGILDRRPCITCLGALTARCPPTKVACIGHGNMSKS